MVIYLKIATLNCNGLRGQEKRNLVFELVCKSGNDVVLLQETYSTPDVECRWSNEWRKAAIWNSGTNNARGVAISVCNDQLVNFLCDDKGRAVAIDINVHDEYFHLVNLYAPIGGVNSVYADQEIFLVRFIALF